jgi:hypothetical protein
MSHIDRLGGENIVWEKESLREMAKDYPEIFKWNEYKKTFTWYKQQGKCDHELVVRGAKYSIGVVDKPDGKCELFWDSYIAGGIPKVLGSKAEKLKQNYNLSHGKRKMKQSRKGRVIQRNCKGNYEGWKENVLILDD